MERSDRAGFVMVLRRTADAWTYTCRKIDVGRSHHACGREVWILDGAYDQIPAISQHPLVAGEAGRITGSGGTAGSAANSAGAVPSGTAVLPPDSPWHV